MFDERTEDLHHIGYEWWMFQATYARLRRMDSSPSGDADDLIRNALLESLLSHARQLIDLFFAPPPTKKSPRRDTDLHIEQVVPGMARNAMSEELWGWRDKINVGVLHLTQHRRQRIDTWPIEQARLAIQPRIDEMKRLLGSDLPQPWIGDRPVDGIATPWNGLGATGPAGPVGQPR